MERRSREIRGTPFPHSAILHAGYDGGAVIVRPSGKVAAGPLMREKGVLYGEIDADAARRSRRSLDVTGHYARPDVFELRVDRSARPAVAFRD